MVHELREIGSRRLEALTCANLGGMLCELGEAQNGYDTALEGLRLARISAKAGSRSERITARDWLRARWAASPMPWTMPARLVQASVPTTSRTRSASTPVRPLAPIGDPSGHDSLAGAYAALIAQADLLAGHVPRDTVMNSTFVTRNTYEDRAADQAEGNAKPG